MATQTPAIISIFQPARKSKREWKVYFKSTFWKSQWHPRTHFIIRGTWIQLKVGSLLLPNMRWMLRNSQTQFWLGVLMFCIVEFYVLDFLKAECSYIIGHCWSLHTCLPKSPLLNTWLIPNSWHSWEVVELWRDGAWEEVFWSWETWSWR